MKARITMSVSLSPALGNCSMRCSRLLAPGAVLPPTSCRCTSGVHAVVSQREREIRSAFGAYFHRNSAGEVSDLQGASEPTEKIEKVLVGHAA